MKIKNKVIGTVLIIIGSMLLLFGCTGHRKRTEISRVSNDAKWADGVTKEEAAKVLDKVIKAKDRKTKELGAGQFEVGRDVPEGRYRATNVGEGSNFFVKRAGMPIVNTILGKGIGSGDYTFWAEDGDIIETRAKVKLIPVD